MIFQGWLPLELLIATLFSSIVGSLHCVGMCGPFAILATGMDRDQQTSLSKSIRLISYHFGRLTTYLAMGGLLIGLGTVLRISIGTVPLSTMGWLVGSLLIGIGLSRFATYLTVDRLWRNNGNATNQIQHSRWLQHWIRMIVAMRKRYAKGPATLSAFLWGLTSTLIPCGWLYVFVMAAAAAPTPLQTFLVLTAFWLGTLPLLSLTTWSWGWLSPAWREMAQPLAAGCLIAFGVFTIAGRGRADVHSMRNDSLVASESNLSTLHMIRNALNIDLPCCRGEVGETHAP